jgi:hypothetical protein
MLYKTGIYRRWCWQMWRHCHKKAVHALEDHVLGLLVQHVVRQAQGQFVVHLRVGALIKNRWCPCLIDIICKQLKIRALPHASKQNTMLVINRMNSHINQSWTLHFLSNIGIKRVFWFAKRIYFIPI